MRSEREDVERKTEDRSVRGQVDRIMSQDPKGAEPQPEPDAPGQEGQDYVRHGQEPANEEARKVLEQAPNQAAEMTKSVEGPERPHKSENGKSIIETFEIKKAFGSHQVLNGVTCQIPEGEISVIMGPSGTGKSVMLRHFVGLLMPDSGDVTHHPFQPEIYHLVQCIRDDVESFVNVEDAYKTHEVCLAADLAIDGRLLATIVRIGLPMALQMVMVSLAEVAVLSFVNRFGSNATAAYGAVNQVASYVQFPAMSIGISASIFTAQCIGARRLDRIGRVVHAALGMNYVIGGVLIGLVYLFAWEILGLFITDAHTLDIAHGLLMITLWSYLIFGNMAVLSATMRASGSVLWPTAINIFSIWGVEVPVAYVLMRHIGLNGVWLGYPAAFLAGLALMALYYRLVWKHQHHERLV